MTEPTHTGAELHALMRELDARCRTQRTTLPLDAPPPDSWAAVLFRVREQRFLTPLEQIAEVLEIPAEITRVPGTKPWFLGVANNRGTLLPIFDLGILIQGVRGHEPERRRSDRIVKPRDRDRVLVVRQEESPCGLVVSETIGMRNVQRHERIDAIPDGLGASAPYVESSFLIEGEAVPVLRLGRLLTDPQLNAAMH